MRRLTLALIGALLAAPVVTQAALCKTNDSGTPVCANSKIALHAIHGAVSPRKRYAIGIDGEADGDESATFLMRLTDGTVLTELKGGHLGEKARYKHRIARAMWSADEHWVAAVYDRKWETDAAQVFRIGASGISQPLDLRELCRAAEQNYFKLNPIQGRFKFENFERSVDVKSIGNDGALAAPCSMQVMKEDDAYSFALHIKLSPSGKALTAKVGSIRRCKDDENEGDCAPMTVPE